MANGSRRLAVCTCWPLLEEPFHSAFAMDHSPTRFNTVTGLVPMRLLSTGCFMAQKFNPYVMRVIVSSKERNTVSSAAWLRMWMACSARRPFLCTITPMSPSMLSV